MPTRSLVSIERRVTGGSIGAYRDAWDRLAAAVRACGAHAWHFRSASDPDRYIEFIEFKGAADPRGRSDVDAGLQSLDRLAPGEQEEWLDPDDVNPTPAPP